MKIEPRARELLSRPIVGQLGYLGLDGEPKVNPTWFRFVDGEIQVASPPNAFKSRSLRRDPRAVLTVSTPDYPYQIASATGQVSIEVLEEEPRRGDVAFVEEALCPLEQHGGLRRENGLLCGMGSEWHVEKGRGPTHVRTECLRGLDAQHEAAP